jgi:hypothetical protein
VHITAPRQSLRSRTAERTTRPAGSGYGQYQRIINVDWERVQAFSQNGITWVVNAITLVSNTIDTTHSGTIANVGIPLVSSVSAGFVLGLAKG